MIYGSTTISYVYEEANNSTSSESFPNRVREEIYSNNYVYNDEDDEAFFRSSADAMGKRKGKKWVI
jgi:hypothetical protein